jgi:hypothetical protein
MKYSPVWNLVYLSDAFSARPPITFCEEIYKQTNAISKTTRAMKRVVYEMKFIIYGNFRYRIAHTKQVWPHHVARKTSQEKYSPICPAYPFTLLRSLVSRLLD